jgi:1-deoxy-D-xylulose-5-phosphate synthase
MGAIFESTTDIQILSPAMFAGSGFAPLRERYADRLIDTGINEAHTVTTAAGIAAAGGRPWVHIYSTFLQRAFDQLVHDIALQQLPVVFLVDRAGIVGSDGPTHHGVFDSDFLMNIPGVTVWSPRNGNELQGMLLEAAACPPAGPLFIRYPKARTQGGTPTDFRAYEWLKKSDGSSLWVSTGALSDLMKKGENHLHLAQNWPFFDDFGTILSDFEEIHVFEESTGWGGLAGAVKALMAEIDHPGKCITHKLPIEFIEHGPRLQLLREHGFNKLL